MGDRLLDSAATTDDSDPNAVPAPSACSCKDGSYDVAGTAACEPCFIKCLTCSGPTATDCVTCPETFVL